MTLLAVENLRIGFGPSPVVHGVTFTVAPGETLALVGESGCGKSLTAFALVQLLPPGAAITAGSIRLDGQEMVGATPSALRAVRGRRIGLVLQEPMTALNPVRTVGAQLGEAIRQHISLSARARRARVLDLLDLVGIPDPVRTARAYPHQLSGGMRQRVMIATAVSCDPALLIADEPTTALDVTIQAQVLDLLSRLGRDLGMALLLITHDLAVVADRADRIAVMYAGRIVEQGRAAAVLARPAHPYAAGLLAAAATGTHYTTAPLREIPGTVASAATAPGCPFAPRCDRHIPPCDDRVPPLHQVEPAALHDAACIRA